MKKNNFDESYMEWKAWDDSSSNNGFGDFTTYQADYFKKILNIVGVSKNSRILEIGFGNGGFLKYCKEQGFSIVGTELNQHLVELGLKQNYEVFAGSDLLRFEPSSFDYIFAFDVIEHIDPDETIHFLRACNQVLDKNGIAVFRFPNGDSPFSMPNFNADVTHVNWIGKGKFAYYSQMSGFKSCQTRGTPELIFTRSFLKGLYHCLVIPIKYVLNIIAVSLFYPGRSLNMLAVDLIAILRK